MFLPNRMVKVNLLVFNRHLSQLTEALGHSGLLHLVNATSSSRSRLLEQLDTGTDIRDIEQKLRRCSVLLEALGIEEGEAGISRASSTRVCRARTRESPFSTPASTQSWDRFRRVSSRRLGKGKPSRARLCCCSPV